MQRAAAHGSAEQPNSQQLRAQGRAEAGDQACGVEAGAKGRACAEGDTAGEEERNFKPSAAEANCRSGQLARLL